MLKVVKRIVAVSLVCVLLFSSSIPSYATEATEEAQIQNEVADQPSDQENPEIPNEESTTTNDEGATGSEEPSVEENAGNSTDEPMVEESSENVSEETSEENSDEQSEEVSEETQSDEPESVPALIATDDMEPEELEIIENVKPLRLVGASNRENVQGVIKGTNITYTIDYTNKVLKFEGTGAIPDYSSRKFPEWYIPSSTGGYYVPLVDSVVVGEGITSIGKFALPLLSVKEVTLPSTVKTINDWAFYNTSIDRLTLGSGLTKIGNRVFYSAMVGNRIVFPSKLSSIGKYAFSEMRDLRAIEFTGNMPTMGENAFGSMSVTAYYLAENKTFAESKRNAVANRFYSVSWQPVGAEKQSNVTGKCGDNLTYTYDANAHSLTIAGNGEMYNYSNTNRAPWYEYTGDLYKLTINSGVTSIGAYAFSNARIADISIPTSVETIGDGAFKEATLNASLAGYNSSLSLSMGFLSNVKYIGNHAFDTASFSNMKDGNLEINLSSAVTIGDYAFNNLTVQKYNTYTYNNLCSLTLSKDLTSIGDYAFAVDVSLDGTEDIRGNVLKRRSCFTGPLTLPSGLTSIGSYAFWNARYLTGTLTIPDSVTYIGQGAFMKCAEFDSIVIGNGVKNIYAYTFRNCLSITSITYGKSVEYIGKESLYQTGKLENIYFNGPLPRFHSSWTENYYNYVTITVNSDDASWDSIAVRDIVTMSTYYKLVKKNKTVTISFDLTGCDTSTHDPVVINKGDTYYPDFSARKNNVSQKYWTTDPEHKKIFGAAVPITEDITLYPYFSDGMPTFGDVYASIFEKMGFSSKDDIPAGIWVYDIKSLSTSGNSYVKNTYSYTGYQVKLSNEKKVFYHTYEMQEGSDYTITYKNNVNAGTATAVIKGKGKYKGTFNYEFEIEPINLNNLSTGEVYAVYNKEKIEDITLGYNGKVQTPKVVLKYKDANGKEIVIKDANYTIDFPGTNKKLDNYDSDAFRAVGKYQATVNGKGNLKGTYKYTVEITDKIPLSKCKCGLPATIDMNQLARLNMTSTLETSNYEITYLKYNDKILRLGIDYAMSSKNDGPVGTVVFEAMPGSDYYGTLSKTIKIKGTPMSSVGVIAPTADEIFKYVKRGNSTNNSEVCNLFSVYRTSAAAKKKDANNILKRGTDYTIDLAYKYSEGKIVATFKPVNGAYNYFIGSKTVVIDMKLPDINKATVKAEGLKIVDGNSNIENVLKVSYKGEELVGKQRDAASNDQYRYYYTTKFDKTSGNVTVNIFGRSGYYKGKKTITFTPEKYDISKDYTVKLKSDTSAFTTDTKLTVSANTFNYTPNGVGPSVSQFKAGNVNLYKGNDYTITYKNNKRVGKAQMIITGTGRYKGKIVYEYTIQKNTSKVIANYVSFSNISYKKTPGLNKSTVQVFAPGGVQLKAGRDYDSNLVYTYVNDTTVDVEKEGNSLLRKAGETVGKKDIVPAGTVIKVLVKLKGNYEGGVYDDKILVIDGKDLSKAKVKPIVKEQKTTSKYDKELPITISKSDIELTVNGEVVPDDGYTIRYNSYMNNKKVGTASVVVCGNGNAGFYGQKTITFKITAKDISK